MLSLLLVFLLFLGQGLGAPPPLTTYSGPISHEPGDIVGYFPKDIRDSTSEYYVDPAVHPAVIVGPLKDGYLPIATISKNLPGNPPKASAKQFHSELRGFIRLARPYKIRVEDLKRWSRGQLKPLSKENYRILKWRMKEHEKWTPRRPSTGRRRTYGRKPRH